MNKERTRLWLQQGDNQCGSRNDMFFCLRFFVLRLSLMMTWKTSEEAMWLVVIKTFMIIFTSLFIKAFIRTLDTNSFTFALAFSMSDVLSNVQGLDYKKKYTDRSTCSDNVRYVFNFTAYSVIFRNESFSPLYKRGRRGRDRMVVGFATTCANSAYHN